MITILVTAGAYVLGVLSGQGTPTVAEVVTVAAVAALLYRMRRNCNE